MKILITFLAYEDDIFAGMEKSIYNLVNGLLSLGHACTIYTGLSNRKNSIKKRVCKIIYDRNLIRNLNPNKMNIDESILRNYNDNNTKIKNRLLNTIEKECPDYILVVDHIWGIIPHINIFNDIKCKIGIVFHMMHNPEYIINCFKYPFDHFFCVSDYLLNEINSLLEANDINNSRLLLLYNCIGKEFFIQKHNRSSLSVNVLCNARISEEKGIDALINTWERIIKKYSNVKLFLTGGDFNFLKKDISISNKIKSINKVSKSIYILKNIPWRRMPSIYAQMDVVILPTKAESFGLAALEAMATGIPLITTNAGNLPYLLEDVTNLCTINNENDIYCRLEDFLNGRLKYDSEKARIGAILKMFRQIKPTHFIIVFDGESALTRKEFDETYKANRVVDYSQLPDENNPFTQLPIIKKVLDYLQLSHVETEMCETDDYIAQIIYKKFGENYIVSNDTDFIQLIDTSTFIYKYNGDKSYIINEDFILKKYGVLPSKFVLFKSLVGDKSDNITGVKGVGTKTAVKLINNCDDMYSPEVYIDSIGAKLVQTVQNNIDIIKHNIDLITLKKTPNITIKNLDEMSVDYNLYSKMKTMKIINDCDIECTK